MKEGTWNFSLQTLYTRCALIIGKKFKIHREWNIKLWWYARSSAWSRYLQYLFICLLKTRLCFASILITARKGTLSSTDLRKFAQICQVWRIFGICRLFFLRNILFEYFLCQIVGAHYQTFSHNFYIGFFSGRSRVNIQEISLCVFCNKIGRQTGLFWSMSINFKNYFA